MDPRKAANIVKEILEGRMKVPEECTPELEQFMRVARNPEETRIVMLEAKLKSIEKGTQAYPKQNKGAAKGNQKYNKTEHFIQRFNENLIFYTFCVISTKL